MTLRVRVDESRLNFPLIPIAAGRLSSLDLEIIDVPARAQALSVFFEYGTGETNYAVVCEKVNDGFWTCYANPYVFPAVKDDGSLHYHVVATDARDNQQWLGTGELRVLANPANGSGDVPPVVPRDCYIRNPVTGLYHLLTAEVDDTGNITLDLAEEGVER